MLDTGYSMLDTGYSMLDTGCWILDTGYWMLVTGLWLLAAGCWILDTGCWMLVTGLWLLAAGFWIFDAGCLVLNGLRYRVEGFKNLEIGMRKLGKGYRLRALSRYGVTMARQAGIKVEGIQIRNPTSFNSSFRFPNSELKYLGFLPSVFFFSLYLIPRFGSI